MQVFVTGGTGYIGSAVIAELRRRGHAVTALGRSDAALALLEEMGAEAVAGSMSDSQLVASCAASANATIHIASVTSAESAAAERAALDTMLPALPAGRVFVYTSGAWVYGSRGDAVVDEEAPLLPLAIVAWRPAHEQKVLAAADRGVRAVVIRPAVVYGDGGGMVGDLVHSAASGPVRVVGDGTNRWPMVRVDALAELYAAAVEQPAARGIYNAGRGASVPYVELARASSRAGGGDGRIEYVPLEEARAQMGSFADAVAIDLQISSDKARRELGWEPHRPTVLEELANTVVP